MIGTAQELIRTRKRLGRDCIMRIVLKHNDNVVLGHMTNVEYYADQIVVTVIISTEELNRMRKGESITILV